MRKSFVFMHGMMGLMALAPVLARADQPVGAPMGAKDDVQAAQMVSDVPRQVMGLVDSGKAACEDDSRSKLHFGVGGHIGFPLGAGVDVNYAPLKALTLTGSVDTNAFTVGLSGTATWNILPTFMKAAWTPTLSLGYSHVIFTGLADQLVNSSTMAQQYGFKLDTSGAAMDFATPALGVDYRAHSGFDFNVSAGQMFQLGSMTTPDGIGLNNWKIYFVKIGAGAYF